GGTIAVSPSDPTHGVIVFRGGGREGVLRGGAVAGAPPALPRPRPRARPSVDASPRRPQARAGLRRSRRRRPRHRYARRVSVARLLSSAAVAGRARRARHRSRPFEALRDRLGFAEPGSHGGVGGHAPVAAGGEGAARADLGGVGDAVALELVGEEALEEEEEPAP